MRISAIREQLDRQLVEFCWGQWTQMGVSGRKERSDDWAMDPEALVILTLDLAEEDARLAGEVREWMRVNKRILSARRLQYLLKASGVGDEASLLNQGPELTEARFASTSTTGAPDLRAPVNFAFRLRHLLGNGARAEVVRVLLGLESPSDLLSTKEIAELAAYSKRNTQEAVTALLAAEAIEAVPTGRRQDHYRAPHERWASLLSLDPAEIPVLKQWPHAFRVLIATRHWLIRMETSDTSDYMLASEAGRLLEQIRPDLGVLGFPGFPHPTRATVDTHLGTLQQAIDFATQYTAGTAAPASRRQGYKHLRM